MATIVTRSGKGSPLTNTEVDSNFTNLNTDKLELSGGTMTGDLSFGDDDKAIFGAGSDLEIFHQSSNNNSIIRESGGGVLSLQTNGSEASIWDSTNGQHMGRFINGAEVQLQHDGDTKFSTTSTGINVTGFVTTDGIIHTGDTDTFIKFADNRIYQEIGGYRVLDFEVSSSKLNSNDSVFIQTGTTTKNRIKVNQIGDISFYEDTGTTAKLFWDASATSLAITGAEASRANNTYAFRVDNSAQTSNNSAAGAMAVDVNSGRAFTITGQGKVGIGTSSPSAVLDSRGGVNSTHAVFTGQANRGLAISTTNTLSNDDGVVYNAQTAGSGKHIFQTAGAERMRIDSSGNLLVGKTSADTYNGTNGIELQSSGLLTATRSGIAQILNREDSDGDIAVFRKDGLTVGSIGARGGDVYLETGNTGIRMYDASDAIIPVGNTGVSRDGGINLGLGPNLRFKDLYLSGDVDTSGVFKGTNGTASAPTHSFLNDPDNGMFRPTTNTVGLSTSGTERMRIDSSGNVGIGTSSPSADLHIVGASAQLRIEASSGNSQINFADTADANVGILAYDHSVNAMTFRANDSERMRIDSDGNVGIGTNDPDSVLHLQKSDATAYSATATDGQVGVGPTIYLENPANSNTTVGGQIVFGMRSTQEQARIGATGGTAPALTFGTGDAEAMRIDSDGNVGIGTDDPDRNLDLVGSENVLYGPTVRASAGVSHRLFNTTNATGRYAGITLASNNSAGTTSEFTLSNVSTSSNYQGVLTLQARTGSSTYAERLRVDKSGNFLLGKSALEYENTAGHIFRNDGFQSSIRSGGNVADFNRLSSDGEIIRLSKDGATVGSIGTASGSMYIEGNPATSKTGLTFFGASIEPRDAGSASDAVVDLGSTGSRFKDLHLSGLAYTNKVVTQTVFREGSDGSGLHFTTNAIYPTDQTSAVSNGTESLGAANYRFKDLYLSGGVYLGGTGSANKLDDYEEGTWPPSVEFASVGSTATTASSNYTTGGYTKIGRAVTVEFNISGITYGNGTGNLKLTGLPFAPSGVPAAPGKNTASSGHIVSANTASGYLNIIKLYGVATYNLMWSTGSGTSFGHVTNVNAAGLAINNINGSFTYYTNA